MKLPTKSNTPTNKKLLLIAGFFVVFYPLLLWLFFYLPMRQMQEKPLPIAYVVFALPVILGLLILLLAAIKKLKVPSRQELEPLIRLLLIAPAASMGYYLTANFLPASLPGFWRLFAFHLSVALLSGVFWFVMIKLLDLAKGKPKPELPIDSVN